MEYNGDIAQIMKEDDDIDFVVPKEGAMRQQDTLAIPKGAPHPENALKFINFIFEPEVGAGDHQDDPLSVSERRRRRADAGELQEQSGDLPAGRCHGQVRVSELSRR